MDKAAEEQLQSSIKTHPLKQYHTPKLQRFGCLHELTSGGPYSEDDIFGIPNNGGGCGCTGGSSACV